MPIQRDHAAEREARIDAFLRAVRRSKETASSGQTAPDVAPPETVDTAQRRRLPLNGLPIASD